MDVLSSLNIDELPEQQTRMMHLIKEYPDFEFRLGFDACCTCGKRFDSPAVVSCPGCKRVKYCSEDCRLQDTISDTNAGVIEDGEESETAMGHSSIICTILQTCNDDDDVEGGTDAEINSMRRHAAIDRIRSEYESYPASLANVISEGPCFLDTITECKQRKTLVFHIIGASQESELSTVDQNCANKNSRFHDYAEALSNLTSIHRNINTIELVFIGPECPEVNIEYSTPIASDERNGQSKMLSARTVKGVYSKELVEESNVSPADIVVFFNPGFTVPEYEDWGSSLSSIPKGTPFLLTTNTEMEGIADCQYLLDQDCIQAIPPALADVFGVYCAPEDDESEVVSSIFSENPFCGTRVRQSGTMGNDLFVKNRWMLIGILDSFDSSRKRKDSAAKRVKANSCSNSKVDNPALI